MGSGEARTFGKQAQIATLMDDRIQTAINLSSNQTAKSSAASSRHCSSPNSTCLSMSCPVFS
jgi:hypothetical protein